MLSSRQQESPKERSPYSARSKLHPMPRMTEFGALHLFLMGFQPALLINKLIFL
ncbi:MAG: hypothetical protein KME28_21985 [Pelatocladus maniniholoensis HA4357-MV3]|uniref:Uncharacterized protein n=1 Tax=Pelatocladus maniniholoensis HA4357-MV3 TaxID=1117104 RepID=A0A9E3LVQ0_9NOST|nr:hypothetical protein [Pelatocladus maniniholoensis HA4357-MV3]